MRRKRGGLLSKNLRGANTTQQQANGKQCSSHCCVMVLVHSLEQMGVRIPRGLTYINACEVFIIYVILNIYHACIWSTDYGAPTCQYISVNINIYTQCNLCNYISIMCMYIQKCRLLQSVCKICTWFWHFQQRWAVAGASACFRSRLSNSFGLKRAFETEEKDGNHSLSSLLTW